MKYTHTVSFAVLFGSVAFCAPISAQDAPPAPPKTADLIRAAQNESRTNDPAKTAAAYEKVFSATDLTADQRFNAHMDLARVYRARNMRPEAIAEYDKAASVPNLKPDLVQRAKDNKGGYLHDAARNDARQLANKEPDKAVELLRKALEIPELSSIHRTNISLDIISMLDKAKKSDEAEKELDAAIASNDLAPENRIRFVYERGNRFFSSNFKGGFASYTDDGINAAQKLYEDTFNADWSTPTMRVELLKLIANCQLEKMDTDAAEETLKKAFLLKDLSPDDLYMAKFNLANLYRRMMLDDKYENAIDDALSVKDVKNDAHRQNAIRAISGKKIEKLGKDGATAYFKDKKVTDYVLNAILSATIPGKKETTADLDAEFSKEKPDRNAIARIFEKILSDKIQNGDFEGAQKLYQSYYDKMVKLDAPKFQNLPDLVLGKRHYEWIPAKSPEFIRFLLPMSKNPHFGLRTAVINAALQNYDLKTAEADIRTLTADPRLSPNDSAKAALWLAILEARDDAKKSVANMNAVIDTFAKESVKPAPETDKQPIKVPAVWGDQKARANAMLEAGKFAIRLGYNNAARAIWTARQATLVPEPRRSLPIVFLPNGPKDISSYRNSDYWKNEKNRATLDRKYGDNLEFLVLTDSAMTGRTVTKDDGSNKALTQFAASCDEDGIKIFFFTPCDKERAEKIRDGFTGISGFEAYLAPGFYEPYICFLIDAPPNAFLGDTFPTQYSNKNFHRFLQKNGNLKLEYQVHDDGVAALLQLAWSGFVKGVPANGDKWEFEPLNWEQGGRSWGGSKSVHNRSSWGDLVFTGMNQKATTAIKRRLLVKAKNAFSKELSSHGGQLEIWRDPELGDLEFNAKVIKPFIDKFHGYAQKIKADMTDEEVNKIYDEAFFPMINTRFFVHDMRTDYLDAQRVSGK